MDVGLDNVEGTGMVMIGGDENLFSLKMSDVPTPETTNGISLAKDASVDQILSEENRITASSGRAEMSDQRGILNSTKPSAQGYILRREAPEWLPAANYTTFMTKNGSEELGYQRDYNQKEYCQTHDPCIEELHMGGFLSGVRLPPVYTPPIHDSSGSQSSLNDTSQASQQFFCNKTRNVLSYTSKPYLFRGARENLTKSRYRHRPVRQNYISQGWPSCPKIVDMPARHLTDEQKADYEIFKEEVARQLDQQYTDKWIISQERREAFARVVNDYSTYAGIPSYVNYTLGKFDEYDESCFRPRKPPTQSPLERDTVSAIAHVQLVATDFIAYYQSTEWDRTKGWSPNERITLLDAEALTIAQPAVSELTPKLPITTMYVLLMHHLEDSQCIMQDNRSSTACFETKGDILEVITGKKVCKAQSTRPPLVTRRWKGEFLMCGFKRDDYGELVPLIVRGQQDASKIYQAIRRKLQQTPKIFRM